jgi:hypothetical protein
MAKRRHRRASLGASPRSHNTDATHMLGTLNRVLTDMELGAGDCRLLVRQLHVVNHLHGEAAAHTYAMGKAPLASFTRELDRTYKRIDKIEKWFTSTCVRP